MNTAKTLTWMISVAAILMMTQNADDAERALVKKQFSDSSRFALTTNLAAWVTAYIELEGDDEIPYTDDQYQVLASVTNVLLAAYPGLSARDIAAHSDISPGRKTDPGPAFDWLRLYDGLGHRKGTP